MPSLRHLHELNHKLDATLHQFEKLDLSYSYDEMYPCSPSSGGDKKTQYPSLYVPRTKQDVMDIPETGKAVVEYVLTGRNMSKRDGKTSYGMDLQIKSFDPQAAKKVDAKKKADGVAVEMSSKQRTGVSALPWAAGAALNVIAGAGGGAVASCSRCAVMMASCSAIWAAIACWRSRSATSSASASRAC